jgi:uncharacterized protein with ATP-grasp and redox domains
MEAQCVSCLISRAFQEAQLSTTDLAIQLTAITQMVEILQKSLSSENRMMRIPAYVGTIRDHMIQQVTGCPDPYALIKKQSNETALKLLPYLADFVEAPADPSLQFRRACLAASLGNVIEYGVAGHSVPWEDLESLIEKTEAELAIDHISQVQKHVQRAKSVLYLVDNAGEVVFDQLLVKVIANFGPKVIVAVKGAPVLNDAMRSDASAANLDEYAEVVSTGGGAVGVLPQWCAQDFLQLFSQVDLVIAKGMGHWETLPEFDLPKPTAHLLRTKCEPVAHSLGVPKGRNIVKLLVDHKGPLGALVTK